MRANREEGADGSGNRRRRMQEGCARGEHLDVGSVESVLPLVVPRDPSFSICKWHVHLARVT